MFDPNDEEKMIGTMFRMRQVKSLWGSDLPEMTQVNTNQLNLKNLHSCPTLTIHYTTAASQS